MTGVQTCALPISTFFLVIFRDLTEGILVGFAIGTLLFLHRMAQAVEIRGDRSMIQEDQADGDYARYDATIAIDPDVIVYRISGAFFFGAAAGVAAALDSIGENPKAYVVDFSDVSLIDSTASATIDGFVRKAIRNGVAVYITGADTAVRRELLLHGVRPPKVSFHDRLDDAVGLARNSARVGPTTRIIPRGAKV